MEIQDYGREFVRIGPADELSDKDRPLQLVRPCKCGCDTRSVVLGVGYLTGRVGERFVTVWLEHEETYEAVRALFWASQLRAEV